MKQSLPLALACLLTTTTFAQTLPASRPTSRPANRSDANGNPIRVATRTGHSSNYDESKIPPYTLPDPLILSNGQPVSDANTWLTQRRPEIIKLYEENIYGRVPDNAPALTFTLVSTDEHAMNNTAIAKYFEGHIAGTTTTIPLYLALPANAKGPLPVVLNVSFSTPPTPKPADTAPTTGPARRSFPDTTPVADILSHGYAYATFHYADIQPDALNTFTSGVIGQTLKPGETHPAPNEWGTISAWAWGISRIVDSFESQPELDAKRIAIVGHSRLGKTVLWAGAKDPRIALVFSSCGGELGSALGRRDFGETIDDMAQNFPWQFAGNLQQFAGHWNNMPVDTHFLISLIAPRPLFITGGSKDLWSDPKGEFLGAVAAGPVYKLLGKTPLPTDQLPALDTPLISGDLAYEEHDGPHAIMPQDWKFFLQFADRHLHPTSSP